MTVAAGGDDVLDRVRAQIKVAARRHERAPGELVEAAVRDLHAQARGEGRRHIDARFEQICDVGQ